MLTNEEADRTYELALAALRNTIADPGITEEQRRIAQQKRDRLILDFIGKAIESIDARTAKFRDFIREIEEVIAEFDPGTTIAGILQLKSVVDGAAGLVSAATGTPALAGAVASPRTAARPTPKVGAAQPAPPARVAMPPKTPHRPAPSASAKPRPGAKVKRKAATPVARKSAAKKPAGRKRVAKKAVTGKKPRAKRPPARRRSGDRRI